MQQVSDNASLKAATASPQHAQAMWKWQITVFSVPISSLFPKYSWMYLVLGLWGHIEPSMNCTLCLAQVDTILSISSAVCECSCVRLPALQTSWWLSSMS